MKRGEAGRRSHAVCDSPEVACMQVQESLNCMHAVCARQTCSNYTETELAAKNSCLALDRDVDTVKTGFHEKSPVKHETNLSNTKTNKCSFIRHKDVIILSTKDKVKQRCIYSSEMRTLFRIAITPLTTCEKQVAYKLQLFQRTVLSKKLSSSSL